MGRGQTSGRKGKGGILLRDVAGTTTLVGDFPFTMVSPWACFTQQWELYVLACCDSIHDG
jgi:hypothetical protein